MVKSGLKLVNDLMLPQTLAPLLSSEKGRYASFGVLVVASLLILITIVHSFETWHADYALSRQVVSASLASANEDNGSIANIPNQHLFGQGPSASDTMPITSLQLRLTGIIKNPQDKLSRAIISEAGQPGKVYAMGEEIVAGVKINAISDDGIILEQNGHFEKLPLVRQSLIFSDKPKAMWAM